jgi:hypothetical protein
VIAGGPDDLDGGNGAVIVGAGKCRSEGKRPVGAMRYLSAITVTVGLKQAFLQQPSSAVEAGFDGPYREIQQGRDLLVPQSDEIIKDDYNPVTIGNAYQGIANLVADIISQYFLFADILANRILLRPQIGILSDLVVPPLMEYDLLPAVIHIDIGVDHDSLEPGFASGGAHEVVERSEGFEVSILKKVLGPGSVTGQLSRQAHQRIRVGQGDFLEAVGRVPVDSPDLVFFDRSHIDDTDHRPWHSAAGESFFYFLCLISPLEL